MTLISWNGTGPILKSGAIGTEQACCCGGFCSYECSGAGSPETITVVVSGCTYTPTSFDPNGTYILNRIAGYQSLTYPLYQCLYWEYTESPGCYTWDPNLSPFGGSSSSKIKIYVRRYAGFDQINIEFTEEGAGYSSVTCEPSTGGAVGKSYSTPFLCDLPFSDTLTSSYFDCSVDVSA